METSQTPARKACPVCARGQMETLNEIVHDDGAVTIYWRCSTCSHVLVTRMQARDSNAGQKRHP